MLQDALGSTIGLVGSAQAIATSYTYQPFGATTVGGAVNGSSFEFTGRENDSTGLYFNRERYYSPTFQRFIAQDPIGLNGGDENLYAYVGNSSTNINDPLGRSISVFDRSTGTIWVFDSNGNIIDIYPAGNNTTNPNGDPFTVGSKGPAPDGTFPVGAPVPEGDSPKYGPWFYPVGAPGDIARNRGIGIHGGRKGPSSPTYGCMRMGNQDIQGMHDQTISDPLVLITIQ